MTIWKKLQNPFALVGQGFIVGGLLFFATHEAGAAPAGASAPIAQAQVAR
jgi:hypothetical protein